VRGPAPGGKPSAGERGTAASPPDFVCWWEAHAQGELRCLLMGAWDPAAVNLLADEWDRYDRHLAGIAARLREHAGDED
jgi:hypothetical protein